jgi:hypothetical protein
VTTKCTPEWQTIWPLPVHNKTNKSGFSMQTQLGQIIILEPSLTLDANIFELLIHTLKFCNIWQNGLLTKL